MSIIKINDLLSKQLFLLGNCWSMPSPDYGGPLVMGHLSYTRLLALGKRMNEQFNWKVVFTFAGTILACLIGSGFATGQEAMQYFTVFGAKGALGTFSLTLIIYLWFTSTIMRDGYNLQLLSPKKIFQFYCGKYLGKFYQIYTAFFLYMVFIIMVSGAGATLHEYYGLNPQIGRFILCLSAFCTVLLSLKNLLRIVSKLGPVVIIFIMSICIINIIRNPLGLANATKLITTIKVTKAAPTWYISGIIYPSMGCMILASLLAELASKAGGIREARWGGLLGGFIFSVAVGLMGYALMVNFGTLYAKNVPSLVMAQKIYPCMGMVFTVILFIGIYTTAVLMLWPSSNALMDNKKSYKFALTVFILTIIAFMLGQCSLVRLVNIIYPVSGYLGLLFLICIFIKQLTATTREI